MYDPVPPGRDGSSIFSSALSAGTDVRFIPSELNLADGIVQISYCPVPPGRSIFSSCPVPPGRDGSETASFLLVPSHLDGMVQKQHLFKIASFLLVPSHLDGMVQISIFSKEASFLLSCPTWTGWFKNSIFFNKASFLSNKHLFKQAYFLC